MLKKITASIIVLYVLICLTLVGLVLLLYPTAEHTSKDLPSQPQAATKFHASLKTTSSGGDSIDTLAAIRQLDSLATELLILIESNKNITAQHDNALSDLRQEGNNFINKVNTWLTLWTAIIGALCALLPIIVQYFTYRIENKKIIDLTRKLDIKANEYESQLKQLRKRVLQQRKLQEGLRLLQVGIDNCILTPDEMAHGSYIYKQWTSIYSFFKEQNAELFKEGKKFEDIDLSQLKDILLYMSEYTNQLQRIIPQYRSRDFARCRDSIGKLYNDINNNRFYSPESLRAEMDNTIELFRKLLNNGPV